MPETYGTWTKLSPDSRSIFIHRYLEAICEGFFENMPCDKKTYPELPLVSFASFHGVIGTIAAALEPQLFQKIILNSPMLRPLPEMFPGIGDRYCTDEVPFGKKGRLCGWSEAL